MLSFLSSDGHTDSDIHINWRNSTVEIGNKEMAQFSVGDASLSTKTNQFVSGEITYINTFLAWEHTYMQYLLNMFFCKVKFIIFV